MLEIACFDKESAIIAAKAGADRIEFCAGLDVGGITPSLSDFLELKKEIAIPVFVMIRARGGNFCYNNEEFQQMKNQLLEFKKEGVDGFVFGILDEKSEVNLVQNKELVALAEGLPCTFHRAFDRVNHYQKSLEEVISCGFKTILTSGTKPNVTEGKEILKNLVELANNRIDILCGGSLRSSNVSEIKNYTQAKSFHSSGILNGKMPDFDEIVSLKSQL